MMNIWMPYIVRVLWNTVKNVITVFSRISEYFIPIIYMLIPLKKKHAVKQEYENAITVEISDFGVSFF